MRKLDQKLGSRSAAHERPGDGDHVGDRGGSGDVCDVDVLLRFVGMEPRLFLPRVSICRCLFVGPPLPRFAMLDRIKEISGVATVEAGLVYDVLLDVPEMTEPATARLISVPKRR